jgi:hypothetical protein
VTPERRKRTEELNHAARALVVASETVERRASSTRIALWAARIILVVMFDVAGVMKLMTPIPELVQNGIAWVGDVPGLV